MNILTWTIIGSWLHLCYDNINTMVIQEPFKTQKMQHTTMRYSLPLVLIALLSVRYPTLSVSYFVQSSSRVESLSLVVVEHTMLSCHLAYVIFPSLLLSIIAKSLLRQSMAPWYTNFENRNVSHLPWFWIRLGTIQNKLLYEPPTVMKSTSMYTKEFSESLQILAPAVLQPPLQLQPKRLLWVCLV